MQLKSDSQPIGSLGSGQSARLSGRWVSWRRCLRVRAQHSGNSYDVARRHRELEVLVDAPHPPVHGLADAPHGLAPAEVLFDALANRLADGIARVAHRTAVNRAAPAPPGVVTGHMGRDVAAAAGGDQVLGVVGLVGTEALGLCAPYSIEHRERCSTLALAIGVRYHGALPQPGAALHEHMALVAKNRGGVLALLKQPCLPNGAALMGGVGPPLPPPVGLLVAFRSRRGLVVRFLPWPESLVARPRPDHPGLHPEEPLRQP